MKLRERTMVFEMKKEQINVGRPFVAGTRKMKASFTDSNIKTMPLAPFITTF